VNTSPMLRSGNTTVVFEGPRRLVWRRVGSTGWVPTALWPSPEQAAELITEMGRGGRLLVVLEPGPHTVAVLAEELAAAPAPVRQLAEQPGEDPAELIVPTLNWLPADLRERGLRFRAECASLLDRYPPALLPRLLVEQPANPDCPIRFIHPMPQCSLTGALSGHQLRQIANHVFRDVPRGVLAA
jgi:hypothetical protein